VVSDGNKDVIVRKVPLKPGTDFSIELLHSGRDIEVIILIMKHSNNLIIILSNLDQGKSRNFHKNPQASKINFGESAHLW